VVCDSVVSVRRCGGVCWWLFGCVVLVMFPLCVIRLCVVLFALLGVCVSCCVIAFLFWLRCSFPVVCVGDWRVSSSPFVEVCCVGLVVSCVIDLVWCSEWLLSVSSLCVVCSGVDVVLDFFVVCVTGCVVAFRFWVCGSSPLVSVGVGRSFLEVVVLGFCVCLFVVLVLALMCCSLCVWSSFRFVVSFVCSSVVINVCVPCCVLCVVVCMLFLVCGWLLLFFSRCVVVCDVGCSICVVMDSCLLCLVFGCVLISRCVDVCFWLRVGGSIRPCCIISVLSSGACVCGFCCDCRSVTVMGLS